MLERNEKFCKICGKAHPTGACQEMNIKQPEKLEGKELTPEAEKILSDFKEFIIKHQKILDSQLKSNQELWKYFYDNFYARDIDNLKYKENTPEFDLLQDQFFDKLFPLEERLEECSEYKGKFKHLKEFRNVQILDKRYWLHVGINKIPKEAKIGKFYLNLKLEKIIDFFEEFIKKADSPNLALEAKIPRLPINRFDKMVVHFSIDDREKILNLISQLYEPSYFEEGIPVFAENVKDEKGEVLKGVGFGEEPFIKNETFGSIRCKILEDIYKEFINSKKSISEFDFKSSFIKICQNYKVNPEKPAYNLTY
jgi:hypothetical protein